MSGIIIGDTCSRVLHLHVALFLVNVKKYLFFIFLKKDCMTKALKVDKSWQFLGKCPLTSRLKNP